MVASDLIRFVAVLTLPIAATHGPISFWQLVVVSAIIGTFGALFDPALQASIPAISSSPRDIQATTGLIDVTQRIARAVGPSLAGFLVAFFPLHHFFTIDAVSFVISAGVIAILGCHISWHLASESPSRPVSHLDGIGTLIRQIINDLHAGLLTVAGNKGITYAVFQTGITAGLWGCAFTVGVPLLVKTSFGATVEDYGLIVGAYGVGNVVSNVILANLKVRRKMFCLFLADIVLGVGFFAIALVTRCHHPCSVQQSRPPAEPWEICSC